MSDEMTLALDVTPLSADERATLAECEAAIERGMGMVKEGYAIMGDRLERIAKEGLYRFRENGTRRTFEEYCLERWRISDRYAFNLRRAAAVVANLEEKGTRAPFLPDTEFVARPLAAVPVDRQAEVWARALEEAGAGRVSAPMMRRIVDEELGRHEARQARRDAERQQARDVAALAEELGIEPVDEDEHGRTATLLYGFFRAIRTLAEMPPPAEVMGLMRPDQEYHLSSVGPAIAWLTAFDAELEKQRA